MRRAWVIVGALAVVVIGGVIVWLALGAKPQNGTNGNTNASNPTAVVDNGDATFATVEMRNTAFTPQNIKVKKGTTVKWINQDTVRHNVIAQDPSDQSGLPAENPLLGKGESYSFTFETIGTYSYRCSPHPFMTGTVEVTE